MTLRITGKNISIGETLRERVRDRLTLVLKPYYEERWNGNFTVKKEGHLFLVDCLVYVDHGTVLHSEASGSEAYSACDDAIAKIEQRLRRHKKRITSRNGAPHPLSSLATTSYVLEAPEMESDEAVEANPVIIAETAMQLPKLSVSAAVQELDLCGAPFFVFKHAVSKRVNMVYLRPDGNIGWIDPPAAALEKAA